MCSRPPIRGRYLISLLRNLNPAAFSAISYRWNMRETLTRAWKGSAPQTPSRTAFWRAALIASLLGWEVHDTIPEM